MIQSIQFKILPDHDTQIKLDEIIDRDRKVINRVLGILQWEESKIYTRSNSGHFRTTRKHLYSFMAKTTGIPQVKYDLKKEFVNISHNELTECIDQADGMYRSYLAMRERTIQKNPRPPQLRSHISRTMGYRRFGIHPETSEISTMYSCKTNLPIARGQANWVKHDKIRFEYIPYDWGNDFIDLGTAKTMQILRRNNEYFVSLAIETEDQTYTPSRQTELGLIGVDLGIAKTAVAVLYTRRGISDSIVLNDTSIKQSYIHMEKRIAKLQQLYAMRSPERYRNFFHYMSSVVGDGQLSQYLLHLNRQIRKLQVTIKMVNHGLRLSRNPTVNHKYQGRLLKVLSQLQRVLIRDNLGKNHNLRRSLIRLQSKRAQLKDDMIKQLNSDLARFISKYKDHYNLYVTVGKPNGIRNRYRRGSGNKWLRKKINQWAYRKFQHFLRHNMAKLGMVDRLIEVNEAWTSIICHRCNKKGTRPKQDKFVCNNFHCLLQINADLNGAVNIAKRGIVYGGLVDEAEYKQWYIKLKQKTTEKIKDVP